MLHIDITNIPAKVVEFSDEAITKLNELETDINGGTVKEVETYLPASTTVIEGAKTVLGAGIAALQALKALGDTPGLKGRLKTLSVQLTNVETAGVHLWGDLDVWIQTVFNKKKA